MLIWNKGQFPWVLCQVRAMSVDMPGSQHRWMRAWELVCAAHQPHLPAVTSPCISALVSSTALPVLRKALWRRLQDRLLAADDCAASGMHPEILALLVPFARSKELHVLMGRLPAVLQAPGTQKG